MNTTMSSSHVKVRSRKQAESMYQVLYENKVIYAGRRAKDIWRVLIYS